MAGSTPRRMLDRARAGSVVDGRNVTGATGPRSVRRSLARRPGRTGPAPSETLPQPLERRPQLISRPVAPHRHLVSTECPGKLYDYVAAGSLEPGTPPTWPSDDGYDPGGAPAYPGVLLHYPPTMRHSSATTWQRQMRYRGWTISVDGYFGPQSQRVCLAFQQEKGLAVDGIVGPQTWFASWNAPITGGGGDSTSDYLNGAPAWPGILFTYPPYTQHSSVRTWQQRMRDGAGPYPWTASTGRDPGTPAWLSSERRAWPPTASSVRRRGKRRGWQPLPDCVGDCKSFVQGKPY